MIIDFSCKETEKIWAGIFSKKLPSEIQEKALNKLSLIDAAHSVEDLKIPPGNKLEALKGTRAGQMSIRINQKYRICFIWNNGNAYNVHIVDYH